MKVKSKLPSVAEQKMIADVFERLDTLILDQEQICEDLREYKHFLLQKMFPKEGEKVPEIRFAKSTDPWERRKLGELVQFSKGTSYCEDEESRLYETEAHMRQVLDVILNRSNMKFGMENGRGNTYEAFLTVGSIQRAQAYYDLIQKVIAAVDKAAREFAGKWYLSFEDVKYEALHFHDGELANENKLKDSADYAAYREVTLDPLPKFKFGKAIIDDFTNAVSGTIK